MTALRWNPCDPGTRCLGHGHRFGGKQNCDAPLQKVLMDAGYNQHWHDLTVDKVLWLESQSCFVSSLTWQQHPHFVPPHRNRIGLRQEQRNAPCMSPIGTVTAIVTTLGNNSNITTAGGGYRERCVQHGDGMCTARSLHAHCEKARRICDDSSARRLCRKRAMKTTSLRRRPRRMKRMPGRICHHRQAGLEPGADFSGCPWDRKRTLSATMVLCVSFYSFRA